MQLIKSYTIMVLVVLLTLLNGQDNKTVYKKIGQTTIYNVESKNLYIAASGFMIDADGAPKAYHRDSSKALDYLGNGGVPGNWWALVTDTKLSSGTPLVQKATDPAPGYYISATALEADGTKTYEDPKRYINSEKVPYIAIPPKFSADFKKGDIALVINKKNNKSCYAIVGDIGPSDKFGEGSIYLASQLGFKNISPKNGGAATNIIYILFKKSGTGKIMTNEKIAAVGASKLTKEEIADLLKQ